MPTADSKPITELVNELLAAPKELAGIQPGIPNRHGEQARYEWPVLVGGQSAECAIACTLYLNDPKWRFTICLIFRRNNIWRLDFEPEDRIELNPPLLGHPYSQAMIRGAHCHQWEENQKFATHNAIPATLPFRVPYEGPQSWPNVWENAFRFFLGETNIKQPGGGEIPPWPPKEKFL